MLFRNFFAVLILVAGFSCSAQAQNLITTVEEAYRGVPHARTPFDPGQSRAPEADAQYLQQLFSFTDQALVARMQALQLFYYVDAKSLPKYNEDIKKILDGLQSTQTPDHLVPVKDLIVSAILDQQNFFKRWATLEGTKGYEEYKASISTNPDASSAHQKLLQAYNILKQLYPGESEYNQQAFFDHLCALDFL